MNYFRDSIDIKSIKNEKHSENINSTLTSKTTRISKIKKTSTPEKWFKEWLVGFTDGDGSFSLLEINNKWSLTFKITQNVYNSQAIYYIKKNMKVGKVDKSKNIISYSVRKLEDIIEKVIPIFEEKKLLTNKEYNYKLFKEASEIIRNKEMTKEEKNRELKKIKEKINKKEIIEKYEPESYKKVEELIKEMTKPWVLGFLEAEGSFYITQKDEKRLVHEFGITQKLNKLILEGIRKIFKIKAKVAEKKKANQLTTSNSRSIENIINYCENKFKGKKAWEMKIWSRSYRKYKGNYEKLAEIREIIKKRKKEEGEGEE